MSTQDRPGPTGKYPRGALGPNDKGELNVGVTSSSRLRLVRMDFGTELSWFAMGPAEAEAIAAALLAAAKEARGE